MLVHGVSSSSTPISTRRGGERGHWTRPSGHPHFIHRHRLIGRLQSHPGESRWPPTASPSPPVRRRRLLHRRPRRERASCAACSPSSWPPTSLSEVRSPRLPHPPSLPPSLSALGRQQIRARACVLRFSWLSMLEVAIRCRVGNNGGMGHCSVIQTPLGLTGASAACCTQRRLHRLETKRSAWKILLVPI